MICYIEHSSPLGPLLLAANEKGLCGVHFDEHAHFTGSQGWQRVAEHALLQRAAQQLDQYFAGQRKQFDLPLAPVGTAFQCEVWHSLCKIPYGATWNYGDVARDIARPKAVRAVGAANGRNPLAIIVPCHRVIGSSGQLVGYAGGLSRKQFLLALEGGQSEMALS